MEGWYHKKHTCIVQFKLKFTPSASKPANKLVQLYYLNEPALNAESLLGEVERERRINLRGAAETQFNFGQQQRVFIKMQFSI